MTFKRKLPPGWYPSTASECRQEIQGMLLGFKPPQGFHTAGLVPHAGWYFSGKIAAEVFSTLHQGLPQPDALCLIGGHLGSEHPVLYVEQDTCETPLGDLCLRQDLIREISQRLTYKVADPNEGDNTLEVQFPLAKYFFPDTPLLAFRAPVSELAVELGQSIAETAKNHKISILVISSADLTHYGPNYGFSPQKTLEEGLAWVKDTNDKTLLDLALQFKEPQLLSHSLENRSSCSGGALAAAVSYARAMGISTGKLLEYSTSYDIMPNQSFVGYAGLVF